MNVPTLPPTVNRSLSRSNSTSSSVATVKHMGSKIGHRKSISSARPTSSDSIGRHFSTLDAVTHENVNPQGSTVRGRSPDLNINRWSHSTSSSGAGAIDADVLRQLNGNPASVRPTKTQMPSRAPVPLRSQYSQQDSEFAESSKLSTRSPGRRSQTASRGTSPDALRMPLDRQQSSEHVSALATNPEYQTYASRAALHDGFNTTIVDHSRGTNKFGQPVEGMALQFTPNHIRQKRSDPNKLGPGLYQATNSSHISLQKKPSHNRRRDRSKNGSRDSATGGSMSSIRSEHSRRGGHRSPTQKSMLSSALSKANQAVLLDNAGDVQGAIAAYNEACDVLQQVMMRSNDPDDRRKLSAIRETYSTRIGELYDLDTSFDHLNKELPEAPITTRYLEAQGRMSFEDYEDIEPPPNIDPHDPQSVQIPLRQESLLPQIFGGERYLDEQRLNTGPRPPPPNSNNLSIPMEAKYVPAPLSPRRPLSPDEDNLPTPIDNLQFSTQMDVEESTSWLIAGDNNSSASSRRSSFDPQDRDHALMSAIDADIDAVVNGVYDDDDNSAQPTPRPSDSAHFDRNFEPPINLESPIQGTNRRVAQQSQESVGSMRQFEHLTREYLDEEGEEEEELLEMMMAEGFLNEEARRPGAMSSLPRQSDSSGFSARSSGRTWESSATGATQGTALSSLTESPEIPQHQVNEEFKDLDEATLPAEEADLLSRKQATSLPPLPVVEKSTTVGLRDRRMSGQGAAQLKIETYIRQGSVSQPGAPLLDIPSAQEKQPDLVRTASNTNMSISTLPLTPLASIHSADSIESPDHSGLTKLLSNSTIGDGASDLAQSGILSHPVQPDNAPNQKPRNLSVTTNDLHDLPVTPGSALFPTHSRTGTISTPAIPNPSPNFLSSTAVGGMYIFYHIPDPISPSQSRSVDGFSAEPLALEPCPDSFLLRPFWLMRSLYQTLAHPRGGYISNKLFVPRDIWRVKGVKIKALDDKVAQCDFLTAALLKLAKVDTLDADAVLEELQSFDTIIENVKKTLEKKLGNEVGLNGSAAAYMKNSPATEDAEPIPKSSSVKSLASSWRKLRSKSSTTALTPIPGRKESSTEMTMSTLPMTSSSAVVTSRSHRTPKHPPPTPTSMPQIPVINANYMSSLARLFDAVQVLDNIARQVEDPGLKATNKTQVGLELSMRNAAEFFGFFILRFAMADIMMLVDKYLKRNGEWIMT